MPTGGGAIHGIGETFRPDLHTGTGNLTVPIVIPRGRNGFQPHLNLTYSSGHGNGPFGLGWAIDVPGIRRKTAKGIPRYRDYDPLPEMRDTFLLSGWEDLVALDAPAAEVVRYSPRTEGLFARIQRHRDGLNDYWTVATKDGVRSVYGTPRPGQADDTWIDPAVIHRPHAGAGRAAVFAWNLSATRDPFGNRIEYLYDERDRGTADDRALGHGATDQPLLTAIRYADFDTGARAGFLASVTFEYEARPDRFSGYRAGFEIRTTRRCSAIVVRTHADRDRLVRRYGLQYSNDTANGTSQLSAIHVSGFDDEGIAHRDLPPLAFEYMGFAPEDPARRDFFPIQGEELPAAALADASLELVDLFGQGLPDILEMAGTVRYWRNLGHGRFDRPRSMAEAPEGVALADPGVELIDADGDGRADLLVTQPDLSGYYSLQFDGRWDRRSLRKYGRAPTFALDDPEVRLVDLTGDGVTDAIRSGERLECFFHDAVRGWGEMVPFAREGLDRFRDITFSDPRVKWADMSGDGMQDIVLVHRGVVAYWPNQGYGSWGSRIQMRNSPRLPYDYDPRRVLIGDVDGDGLADLVYVEDRRLHLWINQSGDSWGREIVIEGTAPLADGDAVRLCDLLGSGVAGLLWTRDKTALGHDHYFFLNLTGGARPYLLREMRNNLGATTRVEYSTSTNYYLEDRQRDSTAWRTTLPVPVAVVARVEVVDDISKGTLTTEYSYSEGYWDGTEREHRGFGTVDQFDSISFADHVRDNGAAALDRTRFAAPTLTRTFFHQGPVQDADGEWRERELRRYWRDDRQILEHETALNTYLDTLPDQRSRRDALRALRGSVLRTELFALDGSDREHRPFTVTEHAYAVREEQPLAAGDRMRRRVFFPYKVAERMTQWERGVDPLTRLTFTDQYDAVGQAQRQLSIACPRGWSHLTDTPDAPFLATQTLTDFAASNTPGVYILDRVARTTTREIAGTAGISIAALRALADADGAMTVIGQTINFFDGDAFTGLPFKTVGDYGALVRVESLTLTDAQRARAYAAAAALPEAVPSAYWAHAAAPDWPPGYPAAFVARFPTSRTDATRPGLRITPLGYGFVEAGGATYAGGYYAALERRCYDFQQDIAARGLVVATRDAVGRDDASRDSRIEYDVYALLAERVTPPNAELAVTARYDYRVLRPAEVIDANGNRQRARFTPSGMVASLAVMGKAGEDVGDTDEAPGIRFEYDFFAFRNSPANARQPIHVRAIRRLHHVNDTGVSAAERGDTTITVEYSDGFGRLVQTRTQGESIRFGDARFGDGTLPADADDPAVTAAIAGVRTSDEANPNVIVSGWLVHDNKGNVIERYEPFFSTGWQYQAEAEARAGERSSQFYDPLGRLCLTISADGAERRVVYGVPAALDTPLTFTPTPWERYSYGPNDNAGRTHAGTAADYRHHWNTPASTLVDALGQTIASTERNRDAPPAGTGLAPPIVELPTTSEYDLRGNLVSATDALGRTAFRYVHDAADHVIRSESLDAGVRLTILDAAGAVVERRDSKGALVLHAHDRMARVTAQWARDRLGAPLRLGESIVYADDPASGLTAAQARAANLLGRPHRHYDEAGLLEFRVVDFKGNLLEKSRRVIRDALMLEVLAQPPDWDVTAFAVDWQARGVSFDDHVEALVEPQADAFVTSAVYDAVGRLVSMRYPAAVDGRRRAMTASYNRAGALEQLWLDDSAYVAHVAYNARGQRTLIAYGNGMITRYAYERTTSRLARVRTERSVVEAPFVYRPDGGVVQDSSYAYDLAGNVIAIRERAPGSGIVDSLDGAEVLVRGFTYDALSRLVSATGRETERPTPPIDEPWAGRPRPADATLARPYAETYAYDNAGGLTRLAHTSLRADGTRVTNNRVFETATAGGAAVNNRLDRMTVGGTSYAYRYDANGNLTAENSERHFEWDFADCLKVFRNQVDGSAPTVYAQHLYETTGERVKTLVWTGPNAYRVSVSVDGVFERRRLVTPAETLEHDILHVIDRERIASVRIGDAFPGDGAADKPIRYQIPDHLGNSTVVVGGTSATGRDFINREEYTPYGETSFGSFARKRYRFGGREHDDESGLTYHGARYYASWLGRWVTCDPAGPVDGPNLYVSFRNNPVTWADPTGLSADVHGTPDAGYSSTADAGVGGPATTTGPPDSAAASPGGAANTFCNSCSLLREDEPEPAANRWDHLTAEQFLSLPKREQARAIDESTGGFVASAKVTMTYESEASPLLGRFEKTMTLTEANITNDENMAANATILPAAAASAGGLTRLAMPALRAPATTLAASSSVWTRKFPGVQIRKIGEMWVKRVDPSAPRLLQWWGAKTLEAQAQALTRLGNLGAAHRYQAGLLIVRDVGPTSSYFSKAYWNALFQGTMRMRTLLHDIKPRNVGANGVIFDPALDPISKGLLIGGAPAAVGVGGYAGYRLTREE